MKHLHPLRPVAAPHAGDTIRSVAATAWARLEAWRPARRERAGPPRTTGLLRRFSLLSLLCVAGGSTVLALVQSRFLAEHLIRREAEITVEYLNSIVRAEESWSVFTGEPVEPGPMLTSFIRHIAHLPGVVRTNIYLSDQRLLWSSDLQPGQGPVVSNPELVEALGGRPEVEWGRIGTTDGKPEHAGLDTAVGQRFVEMYLPLFAQGGERVVAVVEIYRVPVALFATIDRGVALIWALSGGAGLLLYALLFGIVRRADRSLAAQQARLVETETLAAIGTMGSAVAHAIRNPLASIRSSAELLDPAEPDSVREGAADIVREADRADRWLRDLLLGAAGDGTRERVDAVALAREVVSDLAGFAERRGVSIGLEAERVPGLRGSRAALAQALQSLLVNAVEASPPGAQVMMRLGPGADGRSLRIDIADQGPGLGRAQAEQALRPFFTTKGNGTGLGLPLARRIVEGHRGTLAIEGRAGLGTTVTILLPAEA